MFPIPTKTPNPNTHGLAHIQPLFRIQQATQVHRTRRVPPAVCASFEVGEEGCCCEVVDYVGHACYDFAFVFVFTFVLWIPNLLVTFISFASFSPSPPAHL